MGSKIGGTCKGADPMSDYIFHDSYKTQEEAQQEGENIVKVGLAKGVKITSGGKKKRPFLLYILPNKIKGEI
jgi:hypothetical protein